MKIELRHRIPIGPKDDSAAQYQMNQTQLSEASCFGFCESCQKVHSLPFGLAANYALDVMEEFTSTQRLDYLSPHHEASPELSFEVLLPGDRGHMFGVMECRSQTGEKVWLRAFSSLGTGVRDVPGWVPYLIDTPLFNEVVLPQQEEIKRLTALRNEYEVDDPRRKVIEDERKQISRALMPKIHDLYHLRNFRGQTRSLRQVFRSNSGIPGGVGDCCAPKLLNYAVSRNLVPVSIAEFYWGGTNKSGRKQPGQFFEACVDKCQPILGFMLCGLEEEKKT